MGNAESITDVILAELAKAGRISSKILFQALNCGGVQRLLQERENRKISCVCCLNHQLRLVMVHAISVEQAINDFLNVCGSFYNFFRKPTVALHYDGEKLKRLLEQK